MSEPPMPEPPSEAHPFDPADYGRHIAGSYDRTTGARPWADEVALISELAGPGGAVLELGIGTGRLALPLVERGHRVAGVEGSAEMIEQLRAKRGGADLPVELGNFAEVGPGGTFAIVVLAWNTIYALPSQQAQVDCFANAAAHLDRGGLFLIDTWVPDPGAFRHGRAVRLVDQDEGSVVLETAQIFPATPRMTTNKVYLGSGSVEVFPANHRYAWPAELDLMAQLAGMELTFRWADARRTPFTDASTTHVSVWRKK
jgi:SAM-dependent methyltransferase